MDVGWARESLCLYPTKPEGCPILRPVLDGLQVYRHPASPANGKLERLYSLKFEPV